MLPNSSTFLFCVNRLSLVPETLDRISAATLEEIAGERVQRSKHRSKSFPRTHSQIQAASSHTEGNEVPLSLAGSTEATQVAPGDGPANDAGRPPQTAPAGVSGSRRSSKALSGSLSSKSKNSSPSASRRGSKFGCLDAASHSSGSRRPSYLSTSFF